MPFKSFKSRIEFYTFASMNEIDSLKEAVAGFFGRTLDSPNDFKVLSANIQTATQTLISPTTLERLFGYIDCDVKQRISTLSTLSRYIGYKGWSDFCEHKIQSDFISDITISSNELMIGDKVEFRWLPNRKCVVQYIGENRYLIIISENAKIKVGDSFSVLKFMLKHPLYVTNLRRANNPKGEESEYVAGYGTGLSYLSKIQ